MKDRVVMITGAGSGIGRESALLFASEGAKVVVSDINMEAGEQTVELVKQAGGEATFIRCDVSKGPQVEALVQGTVNTYGRLDAAFNNAGIEGMQASSADMPANEFDKIIAVNLKGVYLCMKYQIPAMLKGGGGAIVNTASVAGLVGFPGLGAYVASKHGVIGLTKTAALEYAKAGIRVNCVCPGLIDTPMVGRLGGTDPAMVAALTATEPVGRLGRPSEIGEAAVWLCSDHASFVTGHSMVVDGGLVAQ